MVEGHQRASGGRVSWQHSSMNVMLHGPGALEGGEGEEGGEKSRKWSSDEDERLALLVEKYKGKSWKKVASELSGRTDVQCLHRSAV